jgi:hypothetical protein
MYSYDLEYFVNIAKEVFSEQTVEEVQQLQEHFDKAYDEAKVVAMIAVTMVARIAHLSQDSHLNTTRALDPLDLLVAKGIERLK